MDSLEATATATPVVDCGTFEGSASAAITGSAEVSAEASPAAAPVTVVEMSVPQMQVLIQEVEAIEKRAHRSNVLASDSVARLHTALDSAISTGNVSKALLEDLRDKLAVLNEVSLVAILIGNLSTRLNPSVTDLYRTRTEN